MDTGTTQPLIKELLSVSLEAQLITAGNQGNLMRKITSLPLRAVCAAIVLICKQLLKTVGMSFPGEITYEMASKEALTAVSWNSEFQYRYEWLSTFNTQLEYRQSSAHYRQ